jgi:ribosomal protein S18 acetylase RimI-like enzyme
VSTGRHPELVVRPYEPTDRERVRAVCFETGYLGDPVAWLWRDAESFADMFSGYYTDAEPESAWVVEADGVVSGYLLGAVDARRAWDPGAVAGRHVLRRGIAFRPGTAGVIWRTVADGIADVATRRADPRTIGFSDPDYPAHLHIDLMPAARGGGAGRRLIAAWFERLADLGVTGCHLETFAENTGAVAFFEAVGFRRAGPPALIPGFRRRGAPRMHTQAMVADVPG